jgi:hypothetical protein
MSRKKSDAAHEAIDFNFRFCPRLLRIGNLPDRQGDFSKTFFSLENCAPLRNPMRIVNRALWRIAAFTTTTQLAYGRSSVVGLLLKFANK